MVAIREARKSADERAADSLVGGLATAAEMALVLRRLPGAFRLIAEVLWETGLRADRVLALRVRDVLVAKRLLVMPGTREEVEISERLATALGVHLDRLRSWHEGELADGLGEAWLSRTDRRQYPFAGRRWCWQFVFPSRTLVTDGETGIRCRRPLDVSGLDRAIAAAAEAAGVHKRLHANSLRHAWTARMIRQGVSLNVLQNRLGHDHIEVTDRYVNLVARAIEASECSVRPPVPVDGGFCNENSAHAGRALQPGLGPLFSRVWARVG